METNVVTPTPSQVSAYANRDPLALIAVGIDGSSEALEAARQAGALAGPNSTIELIAVTDGSLTPDAATAAVAQAEAELAHSPARIVTRVRMAVPVWTGLLEEAAGADLLVVARHGQARLRGIVAGSTATHVIHTATMPVLVAARPPVGVFPHKVLVAAGGPDHPDDAIDMSALITERSGSEVTMLRVDWSRQARTRPVRDAIERFVETTGKEPADVIVGGNPRREIVEYARREEASLVVIGSRRLSGVPSLRSVSEHVAHHCDCSVLVVRRVHPSRLTAGVN